MEEKKNSKTISMKPTNTAKKEVQQKLTYQQLNDACNQLWQQNRQLVAKTHELEQFAMNKRLDYLFKVIENSNNFNADFVIACSKEIEEAITIAKDTEEKEA